MPEVGRGTFGAPGDDAWPKLAPHGQEVRTMFFETMMEAILSHPLQVVVAGAVLFYAVCEVIAAVPLTTRRKHPQAQVAKTAWPVKRASDEFELSPDAR
jgi:hypothetical protein